MSMPRWEKICLTVLLVLVSAFWLLLTLRWLAICLFFAFLVSIAWRCLRSRLLVPIILWFAFFGCTWLPFDITFRTAPDGPKFVECCPGSPYHDYKAALELDRRGECKFCSDLVTGFEPRYWVVW